MTEANCQVPKRFLVAEKGDVAKAQARFQATCQWREQRQLDTIFARNHVHFKAIKQHFPKFYFGKSLQNEPVIYERIGHVDLRALRQQGRSVQDLIDHFVLLSEFCWQVAAAPHSTEEDQEDTAKMVSVLDIEGAKLSDFVGDTIEYLRETTRISEQHYPERCAHIYVINVPAWFDLIWSVVRGFLDEVTKAKVTIVRGRTRVYEALCKRISPENIPPEYRVDATDNPLAEPPATDPETNLLSRSSEDKLLYELMAFLNGDPDAPLVNPLKFYYSSKALGGKPDACNGGATTCEVRLEEPPTQ